jgi:two-component system chemotaxis response regulator CheY
VKTVLLVDDSAVVRKTLREMFEQSGWNVCAEAANGQEAIARARELRPDIVVLDLSMPAMNGLTAGRIIKEIFPKTPLVLFTSFGNILDFVDLQPDGFSALIDKGDAGKLLTTAQTLVDAA